MPAKNLEQRRAAGRRAAAAYGKRWPDRVKACRKKSREDWKIRDPEGYSQYRKVMDLRRKGLTIETFDAMCRAQENRCAICRAAFSPSHAGLPHIDHDHRCCPQNEACPKCIRGLLCSTCNKGLGCFKDDPEHLTQAVVYLATRGVLR